MRSRGRPAGRWQLSRTHLDHCAASRGLRGAEDGADSSAPVTSTTPVRHVLKRLLRLLMVVVVVVVVPRIGSASHQSIMAVGAFACCGRPSRRRMAEEPQVHFGAIARELEHLVTSLEGA